MNKISKAQYNKEAVVSGYDFTADIGSLYALDAALTELNKRGVDPGNPVHVRVTDMRTAHITTLYRLFTEYLAISCMSELKYAKSFGNIFTPHVNSRKGMNLLATAFSGPREVLDLAEVVFSEDTFDSSYGGDKWAKIANSVRYCDKIKCTSPLEKMFITIDHIVDLQHNTDTVFNKQCTLCGLHNNRSWFGKFLDKKSKGDVFEALSIMPWMRSPVFHTLVQAMNVLRRGDLSGTLSCKVLSEKPVLPLLYWLDYISADDVIHVWNLKSLDPAGDKYRKQKDTLICKLQHGDLI